MLFQAPQSSSSPRRVVITGAGIVTALGCGWTANADGFRTGRTAFQPVTLFDVSRQRVQTAAQAELPREIPQHALSAKQLHRIDRAGKLLLLAAHEALGQAQWTTSASVPIILGTTSGGMSLGEQFFRQAIGNPRAHRGQAPRIIHYLCQQQGLDLANAFRLTGPVTIIANACASGANAIGHAFSLLRNGRTDSALTGGYDALSQLVFAGFDSLQALSPTECRPFDANRDGLSLGEGAAVLALETLEHARARGAEVLAEICGYGAATDSHHLTQPHPEGDAALLSMSAACRVAGVTPGEIDYINAHGTGTLLNDAAETAAINRWAGENAPRIAVSSTKSSIGHLLGAAGAVETLICVMALREQWLPPTSTLQNADPAVRFRLVRRPEQAQISCALTNSFGFGGANASLVLKRWA